MADKRYTYYVGTFSRWTLIPADNAREAIELGEQHPTLKIGEARTPVILTARVATPEEREDFAWHENKLAEEAKRCKTPT